MYNFICTCSSINAEKDEQTPRLKSVLVSSGAFNSNTKHASPGCCDLQVCRGKAIKLDVSHYEGEAAGEELTEDTAKFDSRIWRGLFS